MKPETLHNLMRLFDYKDSREALVPNGQEVKPTLAQGCINDYETLYNSPISMSSICPFTACIGFSSPGLSAWLEKISDPLVTNANNIRIFFGIYNLPMYREYPQIGNNINRITVFLWPYCDDNPAVYINTTIVKDLLSPYDIGSLYP
jgi:hypothetical protein